MKKFTENLYKKYNQTITIEKIIARQKSKYQNILIFDSKYFGRILTLDKVVQITEFDHYYYSEMLSHLPIISHGNIRKVLIIGGGDGAIASEVLKHNSIKEIFICEIDKDVIDLSNKYLKKINCESLKSPKVNIVIEDASKFISKDNFKNYFDLIIADRPDPIGPGKNSLKKGEFIKSILIPSRPDYSSDSYIRFTPRSEMDIAVVSAACFITLDKNMIIKDLKISLGAVAPTVVDISGLDSIVNNSILEDELLSKISTICSKSCDPIDDKRGTIEFRSHVAGVLSKRAIILAHKRAGDKIEKIAR